MPIAIKQFAPGLLRIDDDGGCGLDIPTPKTVGSSVAFNILTAHVGQCHCAPYNRVDLIELVITRRTIACSLAFRIAVPMA